ncbi:Mu transposase C-terminal domain-containing protein [Brevundimonas sp.]|uniref:Mu transposase C-terminal domain-containing protein n=1 Tax=Brevundimonas sp. TaxID=1871086 RepID=UPI00289ACCA1|nr:Mu transposase C-terminal domain-containing protein [Brevundimonas sp.]
MAQRIERSEASDAEWETAVRQAEVLAPLAQKPKKKKRADVDRAALSLGISTANAYRLIKLLDQDPRPTALLPHPPGPDAGKGLLDPRVEAVISEVLERSYCSSQKPKESVVVTEIRGKCREQGLIPPGRKAVHTRIQAIDLFTRLRSREGENAAERAAPRPGGMEATAPNQIWLIDHTLADLILVDRRYRLPIGRPTITLIIDAYTRMCVGYYVSLGAPSIIQTAMALLRAFMPKEALLESIDHNWHWPCHGFPETLHSDNGIDFKSLAIRRGLDTYGVAQDFRPVRQPRYGALIERFIGTLMGELHLVPGTTFSNVQQRGDYDSDRRAVMTLDAFETWVLLQISRYHRSPHRGIDGFTPQSRWQEAVENGFIPRAVPPSYAEDVLLAFLPSAKRQLSRTGIHFKRLRYWAPWFGPLIRKGAGSVEIRFDPRDMSFIWALGPTGWERVHLYRRQAPFTLAEHELASAQLRANAAASANEDDIHYLRRQTREVIDEEAKATRRARRRSESTERSIAAKASVFRSVETSPLALDFTSSPLPSQMREVEEW